MRRTAIDSIESMGGTIYGESLWDGSYDRSHLELWKGATAIEKAIFDFQGYPKIVAISFFQQRNDTLFCDRLSELLKALPETSKVYFDVESVQESKLEELRKQHPQIDFIILPS